MIILPDKNIPRAKFLMPVAKKEWMIPSLSKPKDQFGNEDRTYFRIRAFTNDGKICWNGLYEDRDDFDAVLFAIAEGTLKYQKELWKLSTPYWEPWLGEIISYDFASFSILTTGAGGGNQTYNKPSDWTDTGSKIECIGAGGSGGVNSGTGSTYKSSGGGGAAYSQITNFAFSGTSVQYNIAMSMGNSVTPNGTNVNFAGNDGGSTWFNDTVDPGVGTTNAKCSAQGGRAGNAASGTVNGGLGGAAASSWGQTKYDGGRGGNCGNNNSVTGGGGAASSSSAGNQGVDTTSNSSQTNGGASGTGDTGVGSAGALGTAGSSTGSDGGNGTNLANGTVGSGGGGGGYLLNTPNVTSTSGYGGAYGGGSGGIKNQGSVTGSFQTNAGNSGQGIIIVTFTPSSSGKFFMLFQ